ncbi:DUF3168 domain-containing protein [Methylophaga lonarensis]|uniref:DUF3168 domain-containing protein n=1 Tax=Methylophaga lonarensis TaxID=999151 RepID=UPI003D27BDBA
MIGAAIRQLLVAPGPVADLVSERVYPLILPQHVRFPCISYSFNEDRPEIDFGGQGSYQQIQVEVDCWAKDYDAMVDLSAAVRQTLINYQGVSAGVRINKIYFDSSVPVYENTTEAYRETLLFTVHVH